MTIRLYTRQDKEAWDNYVVRSNDARCYHLTGWKDVIEQSFGHTTWYLLSEDERGEINGILPLVQLKSQLFGNFAVSLPYFNYGGLCADNTDIGDHLADGAIKCANENGAEHIELRQNHLMDIGWQVKTSKVSMFLPLRPTPEELWKSFPSKLRSQVQKPVKEGMYTRLGREERLDDFYAVFSVNMRDLGTPVYSKEFFRSILRAFPASSWICTVFTNDGQPVAAGFLVGFKDTLEIPWASSLRRYNHQSPNMLLYWSVLSAGCEKGYASFDFGRSTPGEGTFRFKEQWGAKPRQLYWHYWIKNGLELPELNPRNPKYRLAINIWKRLPVGVTKLIGPSIVKNLP
jgi:FemAB-related protein (PEP-CTERM system-associated)